MLEVLGGLRTAVIAAADVIVARGKDGSFLERTLRDALASLLPGACIEQRLTLAAWTGQLGGVDVVYRPSPARPRVGIETKVWDVADSLFDVLKLAAATQNGDLGAGYAVIAGRTRDWQSPSAIREMSRAAALAVTAWETGQLLRGEAPRWSRTWARSSARPRTLPARFHTLAAEPVTMPHVPGHEIRLIGVQATGADQVSVGEDGQVGGPWHG
jgi:hypothetical protein